MTQQKIVQKYLPAGIQFSTSANVITVPVKTEQLIAICTSFYKEHKLPLITIKAVDERRESGLFKIFYIFSIPDEIDFIALCLSIKESDPTFPSLVSVIHSRVQQRPPAHDLRQAVYLLSLVSGIDP